MTDTVDGGAVAPAEPNSAPIEQQVQTPNPAETTIPVKEQPEAKPAPSIAESLKKADAKVKETAEKPEAKAKPEPKEPAKTEAKPAEGQNRGDDGKFAAKDGQAKPQEAAGEQKPVAAAEQPAKATTQHTEAPSRFSSDAKAEWEKAPEAVKAEIHRAVRELEAGHTKYKEAAERYEHLRQYDDIAKGNGRDLKESLHKITEVERALAQNPIQGLDMILREIGPRKADGTPISIREVAAFLANQPQDQRTAQSDQTISELRAELADLKKQIGGIQPVVESYQKDANEKVLSEWAADKPHFADLRNEVVKYVSEGLDPDDAYQKAVIEFQEMARRFGFAAAPKPDPAASSAADTPMPTVQTNGTKSITGAPSSGSDPAKGKPSSSIRDALKRAEARTA